MSIELFSFFSGLGLLDLGFEKNGFDITFVNEYNERFLEAYKYARRNDKHVPIYGYSSLDVRAFLDDEIWFRTFRNYKISPEKIIGFIGGPPCPDFSIAGRNQGKDGENGQLTGVFIDLILKRTPHFFVFENVRGLYKTKKHREFYNSIKTRLANAGYVLFDSIENALEFGVPQNRERLFLIGFLQESFGENVSFEFNKYKRYLLAKIEEAPWPATSSFSVDSELSCPERIIKELTVEYWFVKNNVTKHPNSEDVFKVKANNKYETILEGATTGKSFKRLHRWRYAPTSAYGNNEVHLHPYKLRRISVAEALAIQSAPANISLPANMPLSLKFKMVGNAVPVLLAEGIAKSVYDTICKYSGGECNG